METTLKIKENWNEVKTELKKKFPNLTDNDLTLNNGNEDELITRLGRKIGKSREEILSTITSLQLKRKDMGFGQKGNGQKGNGQKENGQKEKDREKTTTNES